jgi:hypothetical protein
VAIVIEMLARRSRPPHGLIVFRIDWRIMYRLSLPRVFRRGLSGRNRLKHGLVVLARRGFRLGHLQFLLTLQAIVAGKVP